MTPVKKKPPGTPTVSNNAATTTTTQDFIEPAGELPTTSDPCIVCKQPASWLSPTGHRICTQCRISEAHRLLLTVDDALTELLETISRVDDEILEVSDAR